MVPINLVHDAMVDADELVMCIRANYYSDSHYYYFFIKKAYLSVHLWVHKEFFDDDDQLSKVFKWLNASEKSFSIRISITNLFTSNLKLKLNHFYSRLDSIFSFIWCDHKIFRKKINLPRWRLWSSIYGKNMPGFD